MAGRPEDTDAELFAQASGGVGSDDPHVVTLRATQSWNRLTRAVTTNMSRSLRRTARARERFAKGR